MFVISRVRYYTVIILFYIFYDSLTIRLYPMIFKSLGIITLSNVNTLLGSHFSQCTS